MNAEILKEYGIDFESGVARCMNDEAFFGMLLNAFLEDESFQRMKAAVESKDYMALFQNAHELKGVSGNASMKDLFDSLSPLVEMVRNGKVESSDEQIVAQFAKVEEYYNRACEGIKLAFA